MKALQKITTIIAFIICALQANKSTAQFITKNNTIKNEGYDYSYTNAIGIRAGETSGLTFKHFFSGSHAVEGILGISPYAIGITGLYEQYVSTDVNGLSWYFGAGAHVNMNSPRRVYYYNENRYYSYRNNSPGVGIDGILGVEYKIPKVPFALSLDVKPFVEINNTPNVFLALDPGLGIKFTF